MVSQDYACSTGVQSEIAFVTGRRGRPERVALFNERRNSIEAGIPKRRVAEPEAAFPCSCRYPACLRDFY